MRVNQLVRDSRIAVLALQETHLDERRANVVMEVFGEFITVVTSACNENGTGARGVAFVINKRLLKNAEYTVTDIYPGRAMLLDIKWTEERRLRLLNVYGPNDMAASATFWKTLSDTRVLRGRGVDVLLGDFNLVEDALDRLPARSDRESAREELTTVITKWNLLDGWRVSNETTKAYTYLHAANGSQSRIDRIYVTERLHQDSNAWGIQDSGILTDHRMVTVDLSDRALPFVGKGRWALPKHLLTDRKLQETMKELGAKLVDDLSSGGERTPLRNPQTIYKGFKDQLVKMVRKRAKEKIPKLQRTIEKVKQDLH
ncbi:Endonuclease/exonuclease/phosphatase, partial [Cubamyces lactineus]